MAQKKQLVAEGKLDKNIFWPELQLMSEETDLLGQWLKQREDGIPTKRIKLVSGSYLSFIYSLDEVSPWGLPWACLLQAVSGPKVHQKTMMRDYMVRPCLSMPAAGCSRFKSSPENGYERLHGAVQVGLRTDGAEEEASCGNLPWIRLLGPKPSFKRCKQNHQNLLRGSTLR